jgi:hypothetical protein
LPIDTASFMAAASEPRRVGLEEQFASMLQRLGGAVFSSAGGEQ